MPEWKDMFSLRFEISDRTDKDGFTYTSAFEYSVRNCDETGACAIADCMNHLLALLERRANC